MRRLPEERTPAEDVGGYGVPDDPGERDPLLGSDLPELLVVRGVEGDGDPADTSVPGVLPAFLHHDAPLWCRSPAGSNARSPGQLLPLVTVGVRARRASCRESAVVRGRPTARLAPPAWNAGQFSRWGPPDRHAQRSALRTAPPHPEKTAPTPAQRPRAQGDKVRVVYLRQTGCRLTSGPQGTRAAGGSASLPSAMAAGGRLGTPAPAGTAARRAAGGGRFASLRSAMPAGGRRSGGRTRSRAIPAHEVVPPPACGGLCRLKPGPRSSPLVQISTRRAVGP